MINTLQYWFDFCHTSTWINHRCTYVPSLFFFFKFYFIFKLYIIVLFLTNIKMNPPQVYILISFWQTCWSHSTFDSDSYPKDKVLPHKICYKTSHMLQKPSPVFIWLMPENFLSHMHLFYCDLLSPSECETLTDRDLTWFVHCSLLRFQKGVHLCRNKFYKTQRISGEIKAD